MSFLRLFFFFSSRRRHTRLQGDWSSDVCSSDLSKPAPDHEHGSHPPEIPSSASAPTTDRRPSGPRPSWSSSQPRSEERRVGKEWRSRWSRYVLTEKSDRGKRGARRAWKMYVTSR